MWPETAQGCGGWGRAPVSLRVSSLRIKKGFVDWGGGAGGEAEKLVLGNQLPLPAKQIPRVASPRSAVRAPLMLIHLSGCSSTGLLAGSVLCAPGTGRGGKAESGR